VTGNVAERFIYRLVPDFRIGPLVAKDALQSVSFNEAVGGVV